MDGYCQDSSFRSEMRRRIPLSPRESTKLGGSFLENRIVHPRQSPSISRPTINSRRYGQRRAESHRQKGLGMKKELLTVKELAAELRMSPKSIQRA